MGLTTAGAEALAGEVNPDGGEANGDAGAPTGTAGEKGLTGGLTIVSASGMSVCAAATASPYWWNTDSWTATGIHFCPFHTHLPSGDIIGGWAGGLEPVLTSNANLNSALGASSRSCVKTC